MRIADLILLARKIAVGIVITVVPLVIVAGSLWITQRAVAKKVSTGSGHSTEVSRAN